MTTRFRATLPHINSPSRTLLRRAAIALTGALVLLSSMANAAISDDVNPITIVNKTGSTINYLFVSPSDSRLWGPDILDSETVLGAGQSVSFYTHYPDRCGNFDFMAIDEDGAAYSIGGSTICDGKPARQAIKRKDITSLTDGFANVRIELVNRTRHQIDFLFVSPSDSGALGVDMLGSNAVFPSGNAFTLIVPQDGGSKYQVTAFANGGQRYDFNVNINDTGNSGEVVSIDIEESDRSQ